MLARIRKSLDQKEEGFTLIELLVVIIIIGILAAIAIPVFLSQRKKGYDASVKSDLRNAATVEETYITDQSAYTAAVITNGLKTSSGNSFEVAFNGAQSFCIVGNNTNSSNYYAYDSGSGGLKAAATSNAAAKALCTSITSPTWAAAS